MCVNMPFRMVTVRVWSRLRLHMNPELKKEEHEVWECNCAFQRFHKHNDIRNARTFQFVPKRKNVPKILSLCYSRFNTSKRHHCFIMKLTADWSQNIVHQTRTLTAFKALSFILTSCDLCPSCCWCWRWRTAPAGAPWRLCVCWRRSSHPPDSCASPPACSSRPHADASAARTSPATKRPQR